MTPKHHTTGSFQSAAKLILFLVSLFNFLDAPVHAATLGDVVTSSKWLWIDHPGDTGVVLNFFRDGTLQHIGLHGTWKATGPRTIQVTELPNQREMILQFDERLEGFTILNDRRVGKRLAVATDSPTSNSALPTDNVYRSVEQVLALIPASTPLRPGGEWNAAAIDQANSFMEPTKDQPAVFTVSVEYLEKYGKGFRIKVPDVDATGPHPFRVRMWIYFNADQASSLTSVSKGQTITVAGKLTKALLNKDGNTAWVNFDIREAVIGDHLSSTPAISSSDPIIGKWHWFMGYDRQDYGELGFTQDGKISFPTKPAAASWKVLDATQWSYRIVWPGSIIPSDIRVSADRNHIQNVGKAGRPIYAERVLSATTSTLVLANGWDTPMQGGTATMDDLAKLFGGFAQANVNLAGNPNITVYESVPYLTSLRAAIAQLKLGTPMMSKVLVACPGFPRNSLYYYGFNGNFEGQYNRMYIVVDGADQVVAVQLVQESPTQEQVTLGKDYGWHTYNFVNTRTKAASTMRIIHKVTVSSHGQEITAGYGDFAPTAQKTGDWTTAKVDSVLTQLNLKYKSDSRGQGVKERVRWYVPRPLVELILTCASKGR